MFIKEWKLSTHSPAETWAASSVVVLGAINWSDNETRYYIDCLGKYHSVTASVCCRDIVEEIIMMKYMIDNVRQRLKDESISDSERIGLIEDVVSNMENDPDLEGKGGAVSATRGMMNPIYARISDRVTFLSTAINEITCHLDTIKLIGEAKGENATLRIKSQLGKKEPKVKYGEGSNFIKQINRHAIYKAQRVAADKYFTRVAKEKYDKITVAEASTELRLDFKDSNIEHDNKKILLSRLSRLASSLTKIERSVQYAMSVKAALAVSPVLLSRDEKMAVRRFYGTNAGAHFINTRLRNAALPVGNHIAEKYPDVGKALARADSETPPGGDSLMFSPSMYHDIREAFKKGSVRDVMLAALHGDEAKLPDYTYIKNLYRGAHIPGHILSAYKMGDVLENTFVASFAPHIMQYARREYLDDDVYADGLKVAKKFAYKKNYQSHGGEPVIYTLCGMKGLTYIEGTYESEALAPPGIKFKIVSKINKDNYTIIGLMVLNKDTPSNKQLY